MSAFDTVHRHELWDALAYELYTVAEYRARLYGDSDEERVIVSHTLGEMGTVGDIAAVRFAVAGNANGWSERVRTALATMRPLAFAAAFKMQDLIAEWVLGPKPGKKPTWTFKEKKSALGCVAANARPVEFQDSVRWSTFCEVYGALVEPRNVVIHRSGLDLGADGAIVFGLAAPEVGALSDSGQRSYLRAMALIGVALAGVRALDAYRGCRLDAALAALSMLPGVTQIARPEPLLVHLDIDVPPSQAVAGGRPGCRVDFGFVRRVWQEHEARVPDTAMMGIVNVRPAGEAFVWRFAHDALPTGEVELVVGEPQYTPFLVPD